MFTTSTQYSIKSKSIFLPNSDEQDGSYHSEPECKSCEDISMIRHGIAVYPLRKSIKTFIILSPENNNLLLFFADDIP
ncbi:MAG: hypothetical protein LBB88_05320, partial [Planctomycetaceae bacterium]|nr:hypothetical protein [Planctomycetaceae bacterium]